MEIDVNYCAARTKQKHAMSESDVMSIRCDDGGIGEDRTGQDRI